MALTLGKRKRSYKRPFSRYQRKRVRNLRRSMVPRMRFGNNVHSFVRTCNIAAISSSNAADVLGALTFKLSDLPNYTEFTNLFDVYRINAILLKFVPTLTSMDANPNTAITLPEFHTVIDHTDDGAPLSLNEMLQYSNYKVTRFNQIHKRLIRPSVLASAFETIATNSYVPKYKQWLTTDDPACVHYGVKYGVNLFNQTQPIRWRIYATYYIQCKSVK